MTRFVKGFASTAALLALLVGAPCALLRVGRPGAFAHVDWSHVLTTPDDGSLLFALMTLVAWLAWAVLAASVLAEVARVVSHGRVQVHVPGMSWAQPVVAALVVAAFSMVALPGGASSARAADVPPPAPAAAVFHAAVPPAPGGVVAQQGLPAPAAGNPASVAQTHPSRAAGSPSRSTNHADAGEAVHVVAPGDDLWSIAEHYYGDGTRWRQIAANNRIAAPDILPVGLRLELRGLPVSSTTTTAQLGTAVAQRVTVKEGDTLSSIALEVLGDAGRWPEIAAVNRNLVSDPDAIQPGWLLRMPMPQETVDPERPATGSGTGAGGAGTAGTGTSSASRVGGNSTSDAGGSTPAPATHTSTPTGSAGNATPDPNVPNAGGTPLPTGGVAQKVPTAEPGQQGQTGAGQSAAPSAAPQPGASAATGSVEQTSQAHASEPAAASERDQQAAAPVLASVAAMGAFLCAALAAALALRRRHQLARRAPGRRIVQPEPESVEFENSMDLLAAAVPEPPEEATQATAMFGEMAGEPVLCDLEEARTTVVCGPDELAHAVLAAATTGLVLQPWSMGTDVVVAGDMPWITALDEPQVRHVKDVEAGVVWLERTAAARRVALQREGLAEVERRVPVTLEGLRADPDRYEAWAPQVLVLAARPDDDQWLRVRDALAGQSLGLSVLCAGDESFPAGSMVTVLDESRALLDGEHFIPHLVDPTARRALVDLFETAASDATTPAPWWSQDDDLPPNLALLQRRPTLHTAEEAAVDPSAVTEPTLYLLGPVELLGCRGQPPARARRQCVEYCAWIHENPGLTSSAMSRQLLVAEGTRRSNMSRLRTWLGTDPNGELYLPDAYSGRIQLHPAVTSDWEHLQLLVAPGVNRCSTDSLVDALSMVRGAPLADAAPGQWHWAEELRTDMVSTIRDIGVVLAHRAITDGEPDLARWAATRALAAAPEDERLMCAWIRTEHLAGNQPEVERLVLHVTRAARNLGIDLSEETVEVMQQVMEGRRRAQRAW